MMVHMLEHTRQWFVRLRKWLRLEYLASMGAATVQKIMDIEIVWSIDGNEGITSSMSVKKDEEFPDLPRFAYSLVLK